MSDFDRRLTPRGERASRDIGAYLAERSLIPDLILCSPALRTRDTLTGVAVGLGTEPRTAFLPELYNAEAEDYVDQLRENGGNATVLMAIGHNPSTQIAAAAITRGGGASLPGSFPTCAMAIIDCDIPTWSDLRPGSGRLLAFVNPRDLER